MIGNSGDPLNLAWICPPEFQQYLDADTLEGYICQSPDPSGSEIVETLNWSYDASKTWDELGTLLQSYLAQGKQVLTISPLSGSVLSPRGTPVSVREAAFLTYSAARLAGLIWYGRDSTEKIAPLPPNPRIADLHRIRLGKPVTGQATDPSSGVRYRVFERAIVAVNWDPKKKKHLAAQSLVAKALGKPLQDFQFFFDVFKMPESAIIDVANGGLLTIPAYAGRVYLFASSTDYGLNRLT
jgi:hypothetical protein